MLLRYTGMSLFLVISGSLFITGFIVMVRSLRQAPFGYQDQTGFHEGVLPDAEPRDWVTFSSERAERVTPVIGLEEALCENLKTETKATKTLQFRRSEDPPVSPQKTVQHAA